MGCGRDCHSSDKGAVSVPVACAAIARHAKEKWFDGEAISVATPLATSIVLPPPDLTQDSTLSTLASTPLPAMMMTLVGHFVVAVSTPSSTL